MDPPLLWLSLLFKHAVIRRKPHQLSHHRKLWSYWWGCQCCVSQGLIIRPITANKEVNVCKMCHAATLVARKTSWEKSLQWKSWQVRDECWSESRKSDQTIGNKKWAMIYICPHELGLCKRPNLQDRHGWVDSKRNFLSCGVIRKTTKSSTVSL